jgi:hypothetical protein
MIKVSGRTDMTIISVVLLQIYNMLKIKLMMVSSLLLLMTVTSSDRIPGKFITLMKIDTDKDIEKARLLR